MTNVVPLGVMPPQAGEPQEVLIAVLSRALDMARDGALQSFVGTGFTSGGERLTIWHDTHPDVYQTLGSLAWLQHEYVSRRTND